MFLKVLWIFMELSTLYNKFSASKLNPSNLDIQTTITIANVK